MRRAPPSRLIGRGRCRHPAASSWTGFPRQPGNYTIRNFSRSHLPRFLSERGSHRTIRCPCIPATPSLAFLSTGQGYRRNKKPSRSTRRSEERNGAYARWEVTASDWLKPADGWYACTAIACRYQSSAISAGKVQTSVAMGAEVLILEAHASSVCLPHWDGQQGPGMHRGELAPLAG